MDQWLNVAIYAAAIVAIGGFVILISHLLGPRKRKPGKLDPYECGVPLLSSTRERFSVHFYLVAILFILFDIEMVFLYPFAVSADRLGLFGLVEIALFVATVGFAYAYVWRRGGLDWN